MKRVEPDTKKTFEVADHLFHYINEEELTVLCMTSKDCQRKLAYTFLADVRKRLLETYTVRELMNAKAFGLKTFTAELKEKLVSTKLIFEIPYESAHSLPLNIALLQ